MPYVQTSVNSALDQVDDNLVITWSTLIDGHEMIDN